MVVKESFQYCHFGIRAHVPSSRPVLTFLGAFLSLPSPLLASSTALRILNSYLPLSLSSCKPPKVRGPPRPNSCREKGDQCKTSVRGTWTALSRPNLVSGENGRLQGRGAWLS